MFTHLQNTIIDTLIHVPRYRLDLVQEVAGFMGMSGQGVKSTLTRLEKAGLIKDQEGIMVITQDGLTSIRTQSDEFNMSERLARARKL